MIRQIPSTHKPLYSQEDRGDTIIEMLRQRLTHRNEPGTPKGGLPQGPTRRAHEALSAKVDALQTSVEQLMRAVGDGPKHDDLRAIQERIDRLEGKSK